nr:hypothetical protein [uncultured Arsenicibacter sp.]
MNLFGIPDAVWGFLAGTPITALITYLVGWRKESAEVAQLRAQIDQLQAQTDTTEVSNAEKLAMMWREAAEQWEARCEKLMTKIEAAESYIAELKRDNNALKESIEAFQRKILADTQPKTIIATPNVTIVPPTIQTPANNN